MLGVVEAFLGFYKQVIEIGFHGATQQWSDYLSYHPLISCLGILQAKGRHIVVV